MRKHKTEQQMAYFTILDFQYVLSSPGVAASKKKREPKRNCHISQNQPANLALHLAPQFLTKIH